MLVYKITNKFNGKVYIGQTVGTIEKRWREHCVPNSSCRVLGRAIEKHGKDSFIIDVVQICSSLDEMNALEKQLIEQLGCLAPKGYNLRAGGDNSLHSLESKQRMSAAQKGKKRGVPSWNKGLSSWSKGLRLTQKHKDAISKSRKRIRLIDCQGIVYDSITEAAESLATSTGKICAVIRGTRKSARGRTFTVLED